MIRRADTHFLFHKQAARPPQLTTLATYNRNTGLMLTSTDENAQTTIYQYEPDTLRPKKTIYPNGGYVETFYSDKEVTDPIGYVRTKTTLEASKFVESYSYFDGRGLGIRSAVNAMHYLRERIKDEDFYCQIFNRIRQNIETYARGYGKRLEPDDTP